LQAIVSSNLIPKGERAQYFSARNSRMSALLSSLLMLSLLLRIPDLLINGASGIAVDMGTNMLVAESTDTLYYINKELKKELSF